MSFILSYLFSVICLTCKQNTLGLESVERKKVSVIVFKNFNLIIALRLNTTFTVKDGVLHA